jgi:nitroimidazol reductase NimA-like FMN-containing flavoprotein (pyridoxamine 5'-phosphate oxidase superfamily)
MTPELQSLILKLMNENRIMTVATNRSDGWPQATIVGYVNDGLMLYSFIGRTGQKFANIARDNRVSITIGGDAPDPTKITGLSLAARARVLEDKSEFNRVGELFLKRYPEYASWGAPDPALAPMMKFTPEIVSVLDYSKGFGHSDLLTITSRDIAAIGATRSNWRAAG